MSRYETWEKEIEKKVSKKIATEGEMKKYRKVFKQMDIWLHTRETADI